MNSNATNASRKTPQRRKRCSSLPESKNDFADISEELIPLSILEMRVAQITRELDQEKGRCNRLHSDLHQLASDYDATKDELTVSKDQRQELVQLARTQADKIAQLEDEHMFTIHSASVVTASLKSDLMKDLDDKYRELQVRYNKLGK